MEPIEPQKSEIHESTDDSSTSPASNAQQHTRSPHETPRADTGRDTGPRQRTRTNVSGAPPVESDDKVDDPPGHIELRADLKDKTFYPTEAERKKTP